MNHRTYDAQRYSPLDKINKSNVKSLELAYAVALSGTSANENLQSTPMTFEVGGRQYLAIMTGLSQISKGRLSLTPELNEMRNQTMLFVFAL